jgi:hypothetical protein
MSVMLTSRSAEHREPGATLKPGGCPPQGLVPFRRNHGRVLRKPPLVAHPCPAPSLQDCLCGASTAVGSVAVRRRNSWNRRWRSAIARWALEMRRQAAAVGRHRCARRREAAVDGHRPRALGGYWLRSSAMMACSAAMTSSRSTFDLVNLSWRLNALVGAL